MESKSLDDELGGLVLQLLDPAGREEALLELSKRREEFPDLACVIWYSPATVACLIAEIISIYPALSPSSLSGSASNRVCNALALLQVVASHTETKDAFLKAHIPLYLYPFLNTVTRTKAFEYLRLTSLGVIGALVKQDDPDVVAFLLKTEIIPLCLRIMEAGSELSRTVATFIVEKILLDETGLSYVCATPERFYAVANVLSSMCTTLTEDPSVRLLKHVVRCYHRLADNRLARDALKTCIPDSLRSGPFEEILRADPTAHEWLQDLLKRCIPGNPGRPM